MEAAIRIAIDSNSKNDFLAREEYRASLREKQSAGKRVVRRHLTVAVAAHSHHVLMRSPMKSIRILLLALFTLYFTRIEAQQRELEIVSTSPKGSIAMADQSQTIVVCFNQPMVPLGKAMHDGDSGPLIMEPNVQGKYRWMSTTAIVFIPQSPLTNATEYSVRVPARTQSLSGKRLREEYVWQFETPRPVLVGHSPARNQQFVELRHNVLLTFNQRIDPQVASKFISIVETRGDTTRYPSFTARRAREEELTGQVPGATIDRSIVLVPAQPWKHKTSYTVRCRAGLQCAEGPLGTSDTYEFSFTTFGEFSFRGIKNQDGFPPTNRLVLSFSNPVSVQEAIDHLQFNPPVKKKERGYSYETDEMYLDLPLRPVTEYQATFTKGFKDRFGQELGGATSFRFRTGPHTPFVRMVAGASVVESYESHRYPVRLMNVDSISVQMTRVNPDLILQILQQLDYNTNNKLDWEQTVARWGDARGSGSDAVVSSALWRLNLKRDKETVKPIELDSVLGGRSCGLVLVQVDDLFPTKERRYLRALLQVTNLGITSKFSPENNLIWVTNLKDASPVEGAEVQICDDRNQVLWQGKTNAAGLASSPALSTNVRVEERRRLLHVIVRNGNDVAFSSSDWSDGIEPWQFDLPYEMNGSSGVLKASLFTDRGLYKEGERVDIKGVVRVQNEGTWKIPEEGRFRLDIRNQRQEVVYSSDQRLSPFGTFATSLKIEHSSSLGSYDMILLARKEGKGNDEWEEVEQGSFRVEAFRPAEFQVAAQIDKKVYVVGDTVTGFLKAHYLFGAPMKGESVKWRVSVSDMAWNPQGYESYLFGPMMWLSRYSRGNGYRLLASGSSTLDERGMKTETCRLQVGEIRQTVSLLFEGDVVSQSRQVISGRASTVVHGGEYYIGIAPASTFLAEGTALSYKLITVSPAGQLLAGNTVSVKIFRRSWRSTRKAQTNGLFGWVSEKEDKVVDSVEVSSAESPVLRSFMPSDAGFYFFEATSKDARGNQLMTHAYFYVSGSGYVAWERSDDDRIELVPAKDNYAPGEHARVVVKSPYEKATALISIERDGILDHFVTELKGSASEVEILIKSLYLPNVFVSVVLVEGRTLPPGTSKESDVGRPSFKIGYQKISVSPKEKQLSITLRSDKEEYRPGDSVHVDIVVKNALGRGVQAEVAVSVADLGILNLIGYRLPNLFIEFYNERGLDVITTETRSHLVEQREYGEKGGDPGGGGGDDEPMTALMNTEGVRKDFRPSAYWNPSLVTDANGVARIQFKLPDNLTKFMIMGSAVTCNAEFGCGEQYFTVSKPLMLLASLPRFARMGDTFEGGVTVINYSTKEKTVRLVSIATGIKLTGSDSTWHLLKPGQALEVRRPLIADREGEAKFVFQAATDDDTDGVEWEIPIQIPRSHETVALFESLTDALVQEQLLIPKDIYRNLGGLELTAASTAMTNLAGGMSYLFTYPYGCLEQKVSSILPILLANDLVQAFKFEIFKGKDTRSIVMETLEDIASFQRSNGGFVYWESLKEPHPYVSAYAMYAIIIAKRNGYEIRKEMVDEGLAYLKRVLRHEQITWYDTPETIACTNALILYTLALAGEPDYGYMERLYQDSKNQAGANKQIPLFAKAYLLKALGVAKGNSAIMQDLSRDLLNHVKVAPTTAHFEETSTGGMEWIFHSTVRTTALVMQALVETEPENPMMAKVVRWLLENRRSGQWRSTQENLYVVDALSTYFRVYEREEPDFTMQMKLESKTLLNQLFKGRSLGTTTTQLPMSTILPGKQYPLEITKDGKGRLYYGLRLTYYPMGPGQEKEEGMSVRKSLELREQGAAATEQFKTGTVVRVTLTFTTNQDRNYVVIDDPLPAGFEAINGSFQTTASNLTGEEERAEQSARRSSFSFDYTEMRDDRVVLFAYGVPAGAHVFSYLVRPTSIGKFQMPSTRIEQMYEPEVFGQTVAREITIR